MLLLLLLQVDQHLQANCHERSVLPVHRVLIGIAVSNKMNSCCILVMPSTGKRVSAAVKRDHTATKVPWVPACVSGKNAAHLLGFLQSHARWSDLLSLSVTIRCSDTHVAHNLNPNCVGVVLQALQQQVVTKRGCQWHWHTRRQFSWTCQNVSAAAGAASAAEPPML
jgi:hypothetical protein